MNSQNVYLKFKAMLLVGLALAIVVFYNNCSSSHEGDSNLGSGVQSGLKFWTCADNLDNLSLFSRTYHQFTMNKCSACHSGGGPGPGAFASSGVLLAQTSFESIGFTLLNSRALDGHSPSSGPQNQADIADLSARYVDGLATIDICGSGGGVINEDQDGPNRINYMSKGINPDINRPVTVSWNLQTDVIPKAGYDAASFANIRIDVDVQVFQKPGIINYIVSNPRIYSNNSDIHIESLYFKLNGKPTPSQRAFYLVNKDVRGWNSMHPDFGKPDPNPQTTVNEFEYNARLISGGSLVMLGEVRTTDVLSVSIGKIEKITLPPPDLGPSVRFGQTTMTTTEGYKVISIPLILDRPTPEVAFAEVVFGNDTTVKDECCRATRNDNGDAIQVRHFDRDIQDFDIDPNIKINTRVNFDAPTARGRYLVTFRDGESTQEIKIKIVDDQRDEPNEVLHLRIDPLRLTKLVAGTTNQDFRLTITDDDAPYTGNAETYTDLLSDGGLLAAECLRCHNSVLFRGGYDITHYEMLINRAILIPGNPSSSLMFRRMDANVPGLAPMPLTGLLDPLDRSRVSSWILLGAPNN